jgi:hypothetical protein
MQNTAIEKPFEFANPNTQAQAAPFQIASAEQIEKLRATHWHKADMGRLDGLPKHLPDLIETGLKLWARRAESKPDTEHVPHVYLYLVRASHYSKQTRNNESIWAPDGNELTFLVTAQSSRKAYDTVKAQLDAHGLNGQEWSCGCDTCTLILDGGAQ